MSDYGAYDDGPRRHRSTRYRPREPDEPEYVEETTYIERGKGAPPRELILRNREDSIEDIPRDFPPPNSRRAPPRGYDDDYDAPPPRRARSARNYDDYDDDYASTAAGAAGGYAAGRRRRDRSRGARSSYYDDDESPPRLERKKSGLEKTLEGLGLGGVAGALIGKGSNRSRSRDRGDRYDDRSRSSSRSRGTKGNKKERQWAQAAQAALVAGAIEAFRVRNEPGGWGGNKGKRVATAALGSGAIDRIVDRDPEKKSTRNLVGAVVGGLAANRLANGPRGRSASRGRGGDYRSRSRSVLDRFRSKSRGRSVSRDGSRSPPRSKSRGRGLAELAGAGALAAGAKAVYDRVRSKSRGAKERRRSTSSSADSYVPSRSRRRDVGRSRSMPPDDRSDDRAVIGPRGRAAAAGAGAGALATREGSGERQKDKKRDSSSSSESSTDLENKRKKMRGKELLTAGLATIATIHAAHGVYQSMEASEKRHKLVAEGEMTKEEARKKRSKAWLQDAAAVGIAALGIKGAYSEWKEMNEQRHTVKELEDRHRKRAKRREARMREARQNGRPGGGRPLRDDYPPQDGYYGGGGGGGGYADDQLPPPPMGPANAQYRY